MSETNIENIRFKNINELNELNSLQSTDRFIVARKDQSTLGYTTYQTEWNELSADLIDKAKMYNVQIGLITREDGMKINSVTSAIAGNVGYQLLQKINGISSNVSNNFVKLSSSSKQVVSANTYFKNISCDSFSIITGNETNVCNLSTMYHTVKNTMAAIPLFSVLLKEQTFKNGVMLLTDLIPFGQISTTFTIIAKFSRVDTTSTTKKTVSFNIEQTDSSIGATITKIKENGVVKIYKGTDQYYHVMYVVKTKKTEDNSKIKLLFNNGNYAKINISISVFSGDLSSNKDLM